jgi:hypothetical protein
MRDALAWRRIRAGSDIAQFTSPHAPKDGAMTASSSLRQSTKSGMTTPHARVGPAGSFCGQSALRALKPVG